MFSRLATTAFVSYLLSSCTPSPPPASQPEAAPGATAEATEPPKAPEAPGAAPSASPAGSGDTAAGAACTTREDCLPASCCHATACVPKSAAPDCSAAFCTRECRGGTLDCGGSCECDNGRCTAKLGSP